MTNINKLRIVNILLLIGLSLAVVDEVKANLIATFTHNYGSGTGQIDPRGDDPLSDGYVQVTQKSATDLSNFYGNYSGPKLK